MNMGVAVGVEEALIMSRDIRINRERLSKFLSEYQHELHHRIRAGASSQISNVEDVSEIFPDY